MKVGIITFHNAINYGAVLQTYATQTIVQEYGHDVEVIDYHNKKIDRLYSLGIRNFIKKRCYLMPISWLRNYFFYKRKKSFKVFLREQLNISSERYYQGKKNYIGKYDIILIGSDQLWNKKITGGLDNVYWGEFETSPKMKKIAWSICMNNDNLTQEDIKYIIEHLNLFTAISVREKSLQKFLYSITCNKYIQTLDPTLMLQREQWENLCQPVSEHNYIAVYAVQDEEATISFAREVAKQLNKKILIIRSKANYYWTKENKEYCGPREFLSYIRYADFVVTTSFHGTVFSLVFQKQFVCPKFRSNTRIESLLNTLDVKHRVIEAGIEVRTLPAIDYSEVSNRLLIARQNTKQFIKQFLA